VTIFPKTEVQRCIVHQVRNTHKYIAHKDSKEAIADIKKVYKAATKDEGELHLDAFAARWGKSYPVVVRSWRTNWDKLSTFFGYPEAIRKVIYITNTIEGYHRQLRKVTKTKGAFTNEMSLLKLIYLAAERIEQKWTVPMADWPLTSLLVSCILSLGTECP
jgi:putative transposase